MEIVPLILPLIKELIMQYGLWQMAFAVCRFSSCVYLCFT